MMKSQPLVIQPLTTVTIGDDVNKSRTKSSITIEHKLLTPNEKLEKKRMQQNIRKQRQSSCPEYKELERVRDRNRKRKFVEEHPVDAKRINQEYVKRRKARSFCKLNIN